MGYVKSVGLFGKTGVSIGLNCITASDAYYNRWIFKSKAFEPKNAPHFFTTAEPGKVQHQKVIPVHKFRPIPFADLRNDAIPWLARNFIGHVVANFLTSLDKKGTKGKDKRVAKQDKNTLFEDDEEMADEEEPEEAEEEEDEEAQEDEEEEAEAEDEEEDQEGEEEPAPKKGKTEKKVCRNKVQKQG